MSLIIFTVLVLIVKNIENTDVNFLSKTVISQKNNNNDFENICKDFKGFLILNIFWGCQTTLIIFRKNIFFRDYSVIFYRKLTLNAPSKNSSLHMCSLENSIHTNFDNHMANSVTLFTQF